MHPYDRIETALTSALAAATGRGCPPRLAEAMRYAVFPGGARVRPRLCVAVALACGDDDPTLADSAAAAIEMLHCASLVHDDLPCFDDAPLRRGKPSVHVVYGEDLAVLTGDALIFAAFQGLARGSAAHPHRLRTLLEIVGDAVGGPAGVVAGQAWESEPAIALEDYERAKTGSLFAAATAAGALAAGAEPLSWQRVGACIGEAFQVADDILDVAGDPDKMGKPAGQDAVHGRPSVARRYGLLAAKKRLEHLVESAVHSVPPCPGAKQLRRLLYAEAQKFIPREVWHRAA